MTVLMTRIDKMLQPAFTKTDKDAFYKDLCNVLKLVVTKGSDDKQLVERTKGTFQALMTKSDKGLHDMCTQILDGMQALSNAQQDPMATLVEIKQVQQAVADAACRHQLAFTDIDEVMKASGNETLDWETAVGKCFSMDELKQRDELWATGKEAAASLLEVAGAVNSFRSLKLKDSGQLDGFHLHNLALTCDLFANLKARTPNRSLHHES